MSKADCIDKCLKLLHLVVLHVGGNRANPVHRDQFEEGLLHPHWQLFIEGKAIALHVFQDLTYGHYARLDTPDAHVVV